MSEDRIRNKDLWQGLGKIKQKDWIKAGRRLGLNVSTKEGKGSHAVIRDPKCQDPSDLRSLIATVQNDLGKQHNQTIFKHIIDFGIPEEKIWRALKMLK